jgi:hypothetical protein
MDKYVDQRQMADLRDWQKDLLQESENIIETQGIPSQTQGQDTNSNIKSNINTNEITDSSSKIDPYKEIIFYGIITFFSSFAILYLMQPNFIMRKQSTKTYETVQIDYGVLILMCGFFSIVCMLLIWNSSFRTN